jgi:putative transposase
MESTQKDAPGKVVPPHRVLRSLEQGATTQAPTLREIRTDGGIRSLSTVSVLEKPEGDGPYRQVSRPVFLDTGGIDGRQARLRRELDRLKACRDWYVLLVKQAVKAQTEQKTPLPPHFAGWQEQITSYTTRIKTCWSRGKWNKGHRHWYPIATKRYN